MKTTPNDNGEIDGRHLVVKTDLVAAYGYTTQEG